MLYSADYDTSASAVTLVSQRPHEELIITKPSTLSNVLLLNGKPRYIISTTDPAASKTNVSDARTKEVLVKINRRTFFADEVTFVHHDGGKTMKVGKEYLQESKMPNGSLRWDIRTTSGNFAWRMDVHDRLVLCPALDMENPIAKVQLPDETKDFALLVPPAWESMWDVIVGGWVLLEQKLRLVEKMTQRADGITSSTHAALGTAMLMNAHGL